MGNENGDEKGTKWEKIGFWITIVFLIGLCVKIFL